MLRGIAVRAGGRLGWRRLFAVKHIFGGAVGLTVGFTMDSRTWDDGLLLFDSSQHMILVFTPI